MNLKMISGLINATLGVLGLFVVIFFSSSAVTGLFVVAGAVGFFSLFMYGVMKMADAWYRAEVDFQVNS